MTAAAKGAFFLLALGGGLYAQETYPPDPPMPLGAPEVPVTEGMHFEVDARVFAADGMGLGGSGSTNAMEALHADSLAYTVDRSGPWHIDAPERGAAAFWFGADKSTAASDAAKAENTGATGGTIAIGPQRAPREKRPRTSTFGLGFRVGTGFPAYTSSPDLGGVSLDAQGTPVNVAVQFALRRKRLGFQGELLYHHDEAGVSSLTLKADSLLVPLVVKYAFPLRSGTVTFEPFGGLFFSIPLGDLEETLGASRYSDSLQGSAGFLAGLAVNRRLGKGNLFADLRLGLDFGYTTAGSDKVGIWRRTLPMVSLGYEILF